MKFACFLFLAMAAAAQDQKGGLSGVVVDSVTHEPVRKAIVSINYLGNSGTLAANRGPQSVVTDAAGSFHVDNLEPGDYFVLAQRQGYPVGRILPKKVTVKSGESGEPIALQLIPGATVSGNILDEDGDPLDGCVVLPHPANKPTQGVPMQGRMNSGADGAYRMSSIPPGKYILSVQCLQPVFQPRPLSPGPDPPPSLAYRTQYYPGVSDVKSAQVITLEAGSEKTGVDFQMRPAAVFQVRGVFSPAGADWRGAGPVTVQLMPADPSAPRSFSGQQKLDLAKGTFEFDAVFPGSYVLVASSNRGTESPIGAIEKIEVGDKPVDKVIELRHAINLSGSVEIEGNSDNKLSLGQINIQLMPLYPLGADARAQVNDDGSFTIKSVPPAPIQLYINAPNAFLKSARMGTDDVTNNPIDLSAGTADALKIVISTSTATVRGSAPAGQMISLERLEESFFPFLAGTRETLVDQSGQYKFDGLAPGKYRIALSDLGGPMPEEGGQEVTLQEGETVMLDVKPRQEP